MTIEEMKNKKRELGYTNEMIAEISGVPLGTVQKIFSGETSSPRFNTLKKLEAVLGGVEYDFSVIESPMYNFLSTDRRIGVAAGKFKVPDDKFFYDDDISDMFEEC